MTIIGLMGRAYSGKSTAAKHLEEMGFTRLSFAAPLKRLAMKYFGISEEEAFETKPPRVRTILQGLGTFIRNEVDQYYFFHKMAEQIKNSGSDRIVIDDIRTLPEVLFVKNRGGVVVKLECPDSPHALKGAQGAHATERGVDFNPFDRLITAEYGGVEKIRKEMEMIVTEVLNEAIG